MKRLGLYLGLALMAATPAMAAGAATPLTVSLGDVSINKVPFLIAADNGIYAKNGLVVHQFVTPNAAKAVEGSGVHVPAEFISTDANANINIGGGAPMIAGTARNSDPVARIIVSTTEDIVKNHIIATKQLNAVMDLKGKRIGVASIGSVPGYGAIAYTKMLGWDYTKDVKLVPGSDGLDALKEGKADAIMASAMVVALAPAAGFRDLLDLAQYNLPLAGSGLNVDAKWLPANRDTVARFVKATVEATALMKKDRKVFDAAIAKWFNIKDPKVLDSMFEAAWRFPEKPYPAVEGIKGAMAVNDSPSMRMRKPEDFYDASFVAELDKSGYLEQIMR